MNNIIDDFKRGDQLIKSVKAETAKENKALDNTLKSFTTKNNTISSQQNTDETQLDRIFKVEKPVNNTGKQVQSGDTFSSSDLSPLSDLDPDGSKLYPPINHDLIDQYQENQTKVNQAYHQSLQGISQSPNETISFIKRNQLNGNTVDIVYICVVFVCCSLLLRKIS